MKAVSDDWGTLLKANTELKGMTIGTPEEADVTRALPQFKKLVQYGDHWLDKAQDSTMKFIDRLLERDQREKGRSFRDTMLLERANKRGSETVASEPRPRQPHHRGPNSAHDSKARGTGSYQKDAQPGGHVRGECRRTRTWGPKLGHRRGTTQRRKARQRSRSSRKAAKGR